MATEVILPRVDMDMSTGQISRWYAEEGAAVEKGQPLFEIETDKAAMEIEAPASGILRSVSATGVQIPVGGTVAWIVASGEAFEAPQQAAPEADAAANRPGGAAASPPAGAAAFEAAGAADGEGVVRATSLARRLARMHGIDLASIRGSGPRGRVQAADVTLQAAATRGGAAAASIEAAAAPAWAAEAATAPAAAFSRADAVPPQPPPARAPAAAPAPAPARLEEQPRPAQQPRPSPPRAAAAAAAAGPLNGAWLRDGEGVPLVLVHGFGADLNSWRPLVQASAQGRPVFAVDLPGHGGSPLDGAATVEALADLVAAVVEGAGVGRAHLVGHSLGAAVSALVADRVAAFEVRSLLLISPAGLGPDINGAFLSGFTRSQGEESLAPWMRLLVADQNALGAAFVRATAKARAAGTVAADQERLAAALFPDGTQTFSVRDALARIAAPVRLVTGTADRIIPSHHAAGVPGNVAVHTLAGVGHMPHVEARDLVARILAELVRSAS